MAPQRASLQAGLDQLTPALQDLHAVEASSVVVLLNESVGMHPLATRAAAFLQLIASKEVLSQAHV